MNSQAAPDWLPSYLVPFFTLSYPVARPAKPDSFPDSYYYGTGPFDVCFMLMWIGALGVVRDVLRLKVFEPFARWWLTRAEASSGTPATTSTPSTTTSEKRAVHTTRRQAKRDAIRERSVMRFAEQSYQWSYFVVYWSFGAYVHFNLPHSPWRLENLWIGYPHTPLAGPVKFYYLTQLAFWIHSVLVLNAEARRKDHVQMMTHHAVTISLMLSSFFANYTRIGCLILFLMDWCDIWLAFAKMLRYLGFTTVCDVIFAFFMFSWTITRLWLFSVVLMWVTRLPNYVEYRWDPENGHYLTPVVYACFMASLLILLVMMCIWGSIMYRIAFNVARGKPAEDTRSDDELEATGEGEGEDEDIDTSSDVANTPSVVEPVSRKDN